MNYTKPASCPPPSSPCLDCKALLFASEFRPQTVGGNQTTIQSAKKAVSVRAQKLKNKTKHTHSLLNVGKSSHFAHLRQWTKQKVRGTGLESHIIQKNNYLLFRPYFHHQVKDKCHSKIYWLFFYYPVYTHHKDVWSFLYTISNTCISHNCM